MIGLGHILNGLVVRTAEGKLQWSRTVEEGSFAASLDAISVVIAVDDAGYSLEILDESGSTVDSLEVPDTTKAEDDQLERLYVLARRSAHDVDSVLEKLARSLDL